MENCVLKLKVDFNFFRKPTNENHGEVFAFAKQFYSGIARNLFIETDINPS